MEDITILLVEDDELIGKLVKQYLEQANYKVIWAKDGASAKDLFDINSPNAVILDLNLPFVDGLKVAKYIKSKSKVPILMLTARTTEVDELNGFNAGADDYIKKPFSPRVLLARLNRLLTSTDTDHNIHSVSKDALIDFATGQLNLNTLQLTINKKSYQLTPKQANLIAALIKANGVTLSREYLLTAIKSKSNNPRLVDAMVKNLRKILPPNFITITRGVGYKIASKYLHE